MERSRFNSEHILRKLFIGDDTAGIQNIDQKGQPSHVGLPHVLLTFIGQDNLFGGVISSVSCLYPKFSYLIVRTGCLECW